MKAKTICLKAMMLDGSYLITKVTDSVEYTPGNNLKKKEVEELCANRNWRVTITN